MPAVEFHILNEAGDTARLRYACQLVDQAYTGGAHSFICVDNEADAQRIDELLWTFRDQAFIPHEIAKAPSHPLVMNLIGMNSAPAPFNALLINLSNAVPAELDTLTRVIEVVDADPQRKQHARERYKLYRERGCVLETRNL